MDEEKIVMKMPEDIERELDQALNKGKSRETYYEKQLKNLNKFERTEDKKKYYETIDFSRKIEKDSDAETIKDLKVFYDMPFKVEEESQAILQNPSIWDKIVIDELGKKIAGEEKAREIIFLCASGRLVKNANYSSFNLLIHSGSSAGKDYVSKNVLEIMPKINVFKKSRISERVLNYWKPYEKKGMESWDENILYLIDVGETILNCEAFKVMCSEGSDITIMEKVLGKLEAVDVKIKGKPVIITTTASAIPTEEIQNRTLILRMDESEEQTKRVIKFQTKIAEKGENLNYDEKLLAALKELKSYKVKIPFLSKIEKEFPFNKIRMRRLWTTFIDMIKAVAIVHQFQREKFDGETLIADWKDYDIAKDCFRNLCLSMPDIPLDKRKQSIIDILKEARMELSATEIQPQVKPHISLPKIRPHLDSLINLHLIEEFLITCDGRAPLQKYKLSEEFADQKPLNLPNSNDLM